MIIRPDDQHLSPKTAIIWKFFLNDSVYSQLMPSLSLFLATTPLPLPLSLLCTGFWWKSFLVVQVVQLISQSHSGRVHDNQFHLSARLKSLGQSSPSLLFFSSLHFSSSLHFALLGCENIIKKPPSLNNEILLKRKESKLKANSKLFPICWWW